MTEDLTDRRIVLLVMSDGRGEYMRQAMDSAAEMLSGPITRTVIHDDSGDDTYRRWLRRTYREATVIGTGSRVGFSASMTRAWRHLRANVSEPYVFHVEGDFNFDRLVDLTGMRQVMELRPHLKQMALRRQAWNAAERAAGGVVEQNPAAYRPDSDGLGRCWLEHREFWTCNPSMYRRELTRLGWPAGADSERRFGRLVFRDPHARVAYWGTLGDRPWVTHIGEDRAGWGY